jgi:mono/diheme cytochrome c family protein
MRRLLGWIAIVLGGSAALGIVAIAVVYGLSEWMLRHTYSVPAVVIGIPVDPASIIEGRRLATIRGCFGGCHGKQAEGRVLFDEPMIARFVAPNLTAAVRKYSDAELAVVIRNGVRPGGRSVFVMPSATFVGLTDGDLGRIIAFLRSLPAVPGPAPGFSLGPIGRVAVVFGRFKSAAQLIAETVPPPEATSEQAANGRYLARTICAQCHGTGLSGASNPEFTSPNLSAVAAYSAEAFTQLLRTGVALGGRNLGTMSRQARAHLSHLTDAEIAALYSYLHAIPEAARK